MNSLINRDQEVAPQILKGFFGILPTRISADFADLDSRFEILRAEEMSFRSRGWERSDEIVESLHRRLLLAAKMSRISRLPKDLLLFSATVTAHEIAELSCTVSTGGGRLRELIMLDGLDGNEEVLRSEKLFEQIHDSVFVEVLMRYGLTKYAKIFEHNRPLYEIRCEVGRRLIVPNLVDEKEHLESLSGFRNLYGQDAVKEFQRRLKKHELYPR